MDTSCREAVLCYSHLGSLICCLFFNSLLIFCLYVERQSQLQLYRSVLYIQCIADMLAGIFYFFTSFRCVMTDGVFLCVSIYPLFQNEFITVFGLKLTTNYFVMYCYMYPICLGFMFIPLNFYFRYQQLCL